MLERFSHLSDWSFGLGFLIGHRLPIIDAFIESQCIAGKCYLEEGYSVPQERVRSESYPECEPSVDVRLL